tara:strand:+ start:321 stop:974 length:654 start_codon:yes stop_codon:yes gene_type:complete
MKLLSLFKFNRKKTDIKPLISKLYKSISSNLFVEFQKDIYNWSKASSIKEYECFILSKFLIDYSFSISNTDIDKNSVNQFNKLSESVFIELHDKNYSQVFTYDDMKNIINDKYNLFTLLRKDNKPPECWNLIYSALTERSSQSQIQGDIIGLKKAIKSMKNKPSLIELNTAFEDRIVRNLKTIESFDLAEILFRQNIRIIKKEFGSIDISKELSVKK